MRRKQRVAKQVLSILLCIALVMTCIPTTAFAIADNGSQETIGIRQTDFLKTDGKLIRKNYGTGETIYLRGTNAGGYLLQEFWMCLTQSTDHVKCEMDIYNKLTERFGEATMLELVNYYQDKYWTEADFNNCAAMGMNCIRLPIWYRNLVDANGNLLSNAWDRIDWFVQEAGERGMYVILDMHGAPGSQNGRDHSGVDGGDNRETEIAISEFFWGNNAAANQELYYSLWEKMATRYKDNPVVAGYDLLNEPYCAYRYNTSYSDDYLHTLLWDIYDKAYDRIRAIDQNHIIIMEATWDPWDLPDPAAYGWSNVMYEYHNYEYSDYDNAEGKQITSMQNKLNSIANQNYNVPSYMGEFCYFNQLSTWEAGLQLLNNAGLHWTSWTYKTVSDYGNWGLFHHTSDYNSKVNIETDSIDTIKSKWANVAISSENTGLTGVMKKYLPGVNKTTQYVTLENGEYYLTVNGKVVQAPNSGNDPLAALSDSYTGNAEKIIIENNADGTISLKTPTNGKYVCAVIDENNQLLARSDAIGTWEKFYAVRINGGQIGLLAVANGKFVKADFNEGQGSILKSESDSIAGAWEAFDIKKADGSSVDLSNGTSGDTGSTPAEPGTSLAGNIITNPLFENGTTGWTTYVENGAGEAAYSKNASAGLDVDVYNVGSQGWHVQLSQENLNLTAGNKYQVSIDLVSTGSRSVIAALQDYNASTYTATDFKSVTTGLEANKRTTIYFETDALTSSISTGKVYLGLGNVSGSDAAGKITVYSVNVVPVKVTTDNTTATTEENTGNNGGEEVTPGVSREGNIINNPLFENGTDNWNTYVHNGAGNATYTKNVKAGLDVDITAVGSEGWHVQLSQENLNLLKEREYEVEVDLVSTASRSVVVALENYDAATQAATATYATKTEVLEANKRTTILLLSDVVEEATTTGKLYIGLGNVSGSDAASKVTIYSVNVVPIEPAYVDPVEIKVTEIKPSVSNISMKKGEKQTIGVNVTPVDATNREVSYSSDNANVVMVADDGTITGVSAGTATITITAKDGSGVNATVRVTITEEKTTEEKTTEEKTTEEKVTEEKTTEERTTEEKTTEEKTTEEKTTEEKITEEKTTEEKTTEEKTTEEKTTEEKTTEEKTTEEKTTEEKTTEEKTTEEKTAEEKTTEEKRTEEKTEEKTEQDKTTEENTTGNNGSGGNSGNEDTTESGGNTEGGGTTENGDNTGNGNNTGNEGGTNTEHGNNTGNVGGDNTGNQGETTVIPDGGSNVTPDTGNQNTNTGTTNNNQNTDTNSSNNNQNSSTDTTVKKGTAFTVGKFKYKVTGDMAGAYTVELTGVTKKTLKKAVIPQTVKYQGISYKVTSIGKKAFYKNKKLKSVTIGKNVTNIGTKAFYGCKNLKTIKVKSSEITKIGKNAFRSIYKKAVIKVPAKKLNNYKKMIQKSKISSSVKIKK